MDYSKLLSAVVTERPSSSGGGSDRNNKRLAPLRSCKWVCFILFSGLWLVPAVYILSINFRGQVNPRARVIGQSIGCLGNSKKCQINLQEVTQIAQAKKLASLDRNALGALQLAAKGLEIWFVAIAASLIFIMVKTIARRTSRPSLPLRFLHLHSVLGEPVEVGKLLFWKPLEKPLGNLLQHIRRSNLSEYQAVRCNDGDHGLMFWRVSRLCLFSVFAIMVSIVCSFMGPATAVLVLPSMQWTIINSNTSSPPIWLDKIKAGPPELGFDIPPCTTGDFTAGKFSCLWDYYSSFIDSLAAGAVATDTHAFMGGRTQGGIESTLVAIPPFQEGNVTFSANISGGNPAIWVPLRQVLRDFNKDIEDYDLVTSTSIHPQPDYPDSDLFRKSLQARIQRDSPTIGMQSNCRLHGPREQTVSTVSLGADRTVRCYKASDRTTCIPSGKGWSNINRDSSSFKVLDADTTTQQDVNVAVYSASTSMTMDSSEFKCIGDGTCGWDWSTAFSTQAARTNMTVAGPLQTVEYTIPNMADLTQNSSVWCVSKYAVNTATYALDPSLVTNLFRLVDLNVEGDNGSLDTGSPLYVDSDWILAGWAVDRNGSVNGGRNAAARLNVAWQTWVSKGDGDQSFADFINIHRFIAIQSLSLIPFNTTSTLPLGKVESRRPISNHAQIQAWTYDLSSNTSKLGAVVMMAGCVIVLIRTVLYWCYGDDVMDATEILESILERYPFVRGGERFDAEETYPELVLDETARVVGFRA